jgi:uncharacterized cupin superfamily protein
MEFEAFDFFTGVVATLVAGTLYALAQFRQQLRDLLKMRTPAASQAQHLPMELQTVPADWIKSGSPVFKSCEFASMPHTETYCGIWSCEGPASFEWQFGADEYVHVLEGRVEIEYRGEHFVLEAGGTALFYANTRALWTVPQYVRKSYTLHCPSNMVQRIRRWLRLV